MLLYWRMSYLAQKKSYKKHAFFIIIFPDGEQALIKGEKSWASLIPYTKYLKEDFEEGTFIVAISWLEAIKFVLKGQVFNVSK